MKKALSFVLEEFIIRVTKSGSSTAPVVPALDRTGWTATATSQHHNSGDSDGPTSNLLDGRLESIWHTNYPGGSGTGDMAYGFSGFDGTDGIISIRNPHSSQAKTIEFTFDRIIGVPEDSSTLKYYMVHDYRMPEGNSRTGEFTYGQTYTFTLQPNEVRMFQISKDGDTTAPVMERAFSDGDKTITVRFNEKVIGNEFTVSGATVESVEQSADNVTYRITLTEAPENKANVTDSLQTNYGFTVSANVASADAGVLVSQGEAYVLGINSNGYAYFTVNGTTAVSDVKVAVADGAQTASIIGVKENNGMLKIYVNNTNNTLAGSAYNAENRYFAVPAAAIAVSEKAAKAAVYDIAYGYDELNIAEAPESTIIEGVTGEASSTDDTEAGVDKSVGNAFDGNVDTFWATVPNGTLADAYLIADLGEVYDINQVDYTKRFDTAAKYNCTGNLLDYVISVSTDGKTWTEVKSGETIDGTTEITFEPVAARYVKLTATRSYHWQESSANTVMCVAEMAVHKYVEPIDPNDPWGKSKWIKVEVDSETIWNEREGNFEYAWDGDLNTIWHSNWQGAHDVLTGENTISGTIDFTKEHYINQFSFTPRQDNTQWENGICTVCGHLNNPFTDVPNDSFCIDAVLWAAEKGITEGTSPDTFSPAEQCNRAQVVTFLYRTYN